jgi:hypothetical protein
MTRMLWLVALVAGCAVEEVIVDTGEAAEPTDSEPVWPERPTVVEPEPDPETDPGPGTMATLDPSTAPVGSALLVFFAAEGVDFDEAVAVDLYGEPDAAISAWSARGEELVLSLEIAASSPPGDLVVIVELADGELVRATEPFIVTE